MVSVDATSDNAARTRSGPYTMTDTERERIKTTMIRDTFWRIVNSL